MLVLANEIFNSPPVFAWVLPVVVRLQPGKEETFSPASRILFFPRQSSKRRHKTMLKGVGKGQGKGKGKPEGKGKGKGKGAGVGNTYVDPGRPKIFQLSDARKTANLCIRQRSLSMCDGTCSTRMDTLSPASPRREWIQGGLPCTLRLSWRSGG
jgi:hypothetical protein